MKLKKLIGVMAVAGFVLPGAAMATNGYFSHGYGMKAKGMAGAATAMTEDTFGGANNPATMVWVGNRFDVGVDWFSPKRAAKREGSGGGGANDFSQASGSNNFLVPEMGYNRMLDANMSLGVTVYGNGGMNSDYAGGTNSLLGCGMGATATLTQNALCGNGKLGVNLEQLIIAPTWAYKVNATNSIGVSPLFGYQHFRANGLSAFAAMSTDPNNLTDKGHDQASGWGVRVGWLGKISDTVTLGAAYSSKIDMSKFDKYKGLFAGQGDFDIPENYNFGIAFKATPELTVAVDLQHISYGKVGAIANSSQTACTHVNPAGPATESGCLGGSGGVGFGWGDVDVVKIGLQYQYNKDLVLRAGYNHGDNPIQARDVTFNILAPGVVQDHYTLGATYNIDKASELTVSYMHAQEKSVSGATNPTHFAVGGTETIKMYQNSLGVAYGMKF